LYWKYISHNDNNNHISCEIMATLETQKTVVVGAGPVGALAALYAAQRGDIVEVYELRGGK
jgi:NADPH-dependent 2,4-dienoyl-CoA reductase/sulfur reductase-like enzyme